MPKLSSGRHTAGSLRETVENVKEIVKQLENTAMAIEAMPDVEAVLIEKEVSREDGLTFLQQWADRARDAVRKARLESLQSRVSAKSDTYPAANGSAPKSTRTTRRISPDKKVADTHKGNAKD